MKKVRLLFGALSVVLLLVSVAQMMNRHLYAGSFKFFEMLMDYVPLVFLAIVSLVLSAGLTSRRVKWNKRFSLAGALLLLPQMIVHSIHFVPAATGSPIYRTLSYLGMLSNSIVLCAMVVLLILFFFERQRLYGYGFIVLMVCMAVNMGLNIVSGNQLSFSILATVLIVLANGLLLTPFAVFWLEGKQYETTKPQA